MRRLKFNKWIYDKNKKEFEFILKVWKTTRKKYTREQYYNWYKSIIDKVNDDEDSDESDPRDYDRLTNVEYLHLKLNDISQEPYFYDYIPHFLIFVDDAFNTSVYRDSKKNVYLNFCIKHRHYNTSIIMAVQSYTGGINKSLRKNVSAWFLWKQPNNDLHTIYDEVISDIIDNENDFIKLFKDVTKDRHDFLLIDKESQKNELVLRKGFNEIFIFDENKEKEKEENQEEKDGKR